jgi:hypothetical protein
MKLTGLTDITPFYEKPLNVTLRALPSNPLGVTEAPDPRPLIKGSLRSAETLTSIFPLKSQMTVEGGVWTLVEVQVAGPDSLADYAIRMLPAKVVGAALVRVRTQPPVAYTATTGRAQFYVQVSNSSSSFQQVRLTFTADGASVVSPSLFITVSPGNAVQSRDIFFQGSAELPYHELGRIMATELFETVRVLGHIDQSTIPKEQKPLVGKSAYHGAGIPALNSISPHLAKVLDAYKRLQGSKERSAGRAAGFSTNVLHTVHRSSEVPIVAAAAAFAPNDIAGYVTLLNKAGKASAGAVATAVPDYAYGNTLRKSSVAEQLNAQHIRLSASATLNIEGAFIDTAATQIVSNSRFHHTVTDTQQVAAQYSWTRTEKQRVNLAQFQTEYVHGTNCRVLNHNKDYIGINEIYSDSLNIQVGTLVGPGVGLGPKGAMSIHALYAAQFGSSLGATQIASALDTLVTANSGRTALVNQTGVTEVLGRAATVVDSIGPTTVNSDVFTAIDAPIVFINMGRSTLLPPPEPVVFPAAGPVPLASIPPLPYLKTPADSAGPAPKQFPYTSQPTEPRSGPDIGKILSPGGQLLPNLIKGVELLQKVFK